MSKGKKKKKVTEQPVKEKKPSLLPAWLWTCIALGGFAALTSFLIPLLMSSFDMQKKLMLYVCGIAMPLLTTGAFTLYHLGKKIDAYVLAGTCTLVPAVLFCFGFYSWLDLIVFGGLAMVLLFFIIFYKKGSKKRGFQYTLAIVGAMTAMFYVVMAVSYVFTGLSMSGEVNKLEYVLVSLYYMGLGAYFAVYGVGGWSNIEREKEDMLNSRRLRY